ncbi:MAG TPA: type I-D CRISPR-associated protein Cas7/Csc2 [Ktedonobacteraceae bacterium]|nr:type I-D CRISPR-associated protein Cas7/Csc2 [Ktedonobacteraceae bacterium]
MFLNTLESFDVFHTAIPSLPMGKYAHIVILRETNSFALFQTDGELNIARVSNGRKSQGQATRIVLFKRKQSTPERLTGRELLRRYGLVETCEYNSKDFCKHCPDCIYYGFAIGDKGSERSKVLVDSAFSITGYDMSHQQFTFNAPFENGTMSERGEMKTALGEQDYVLPQVYFPSIVTIKDPTEAEFIYVLNNIMRTKRYGAQNTRTGTVENHIVGVIFADGEIFSNLQLTQAVYDALTPEQLARTPLAQAEVLSAMHSVVPALLAEDNVVSEPIMGERLSRLLQEINQIASDERRLQAVLSQANVETNKYAVDHGVDANKGAKAKK